MTQDEAGEEAAGGARIPGGELRHTYETRFNANEQVNDV